MAMFPLAVACINNIHWYNIVIKNVLELKNNKNLPITLYNSKKLRKNCKTYTDYITIVLINDESIIELI